MQRFAGIKNDKIQVVSDRAFEHNDANIIAIPKEFDDISSSELITNYSYRNGEFRSKFATKLAPNLRVAFVSNWHMNCGIATYAEKLFAEIIPLVGDHRLFVEKNDGVIDSDTVIQCWKRGEYPKDLIANIKAYDPDIVAIQHEFGIWPNARHWLSLMSQLSDYRVITTMHSVFPTHRDKTICEAAMHEIVVHLDGAKEALINIKQISAKVSVIPHGCDLTLNKEKLWNFYKSNHTFVQFGFGFRYKNFEHSIRTAAILRDKYKDVFLTILFSESSAGPNAHQTYYNELMKLVNDLDLHENVAIIRGYQSDEAANCFLQTNKVAIFPYASQQGHAVFGASGAARSAMAANIPVITSQISHFSDLPTIKTSTPEGSAEALSNLFDDAGIYRAQLLQQEQYMSTHSWKNMAARYVELFTNKKQ